MPGRVGMMAGPFLGASYGMGGARAAILGWPADRTGARSSDRVSASPPIIGPPAAFLPSPGRPRRGLDAADIIH